ALTRLALWLGAPLRGRTGARGEAERGLADDAVREALASHPMARIRDLAARLAGMYGEAAYHDSLTGLPNRELLLDRLGVAVAQALRTKEDIALLHIDLDHFLGPQRL